MMNNVLSDNTSRIPIFGACSVLQLYTNSQQACLAGNRGIVRPAAVKTGTTQDFRDGWTLGSTIDYMLGVWTGNNDDSSMINVSGEIGAAPIWHNAMLLAEQGQPIRDFQNPGGLTRATVTYPDDIRATDWFLPNSVPNFPNMPNLNPTPSAVPASFCGTYSFAFAFPAGTSIPTNGNWW
jgi:membrane carboxypeptidase/penicillin-binding protein PbpC